MITEGSMLNWKFWNATLDKRESSSNYDKEGRRGRCLTLWPLTVFEICTIQVKAGTDHRQKQQQLRMKTHTEGVSLAGISPLPQSN